jgi:hypothetical protein
MTDSLISNHTAYVASLRGCPSCPDRLSVLAGMRNTGQSETGRDPNEKYVAIKLTRQSSTLLLSKPP